MYLDMDGKEIKIGSSACFKHGTEMYGRVTGFDRGMVQINVWDGDAGEYYSVSKAPRQCWQEG